MTNDGAELRAEDWLLWGCGPCGHRLSWIHLMLCRVPRAILYPTYHVLCCAVLPCLFLPGLAPIRPRRAKPKLTGCTLLMASCGFAATIQAAFVHAPSHAQRAWGSREGWHLAAIRPVVARPRPPRPPTLRYAASPPGRGPAPFSPHESAALRHTAPRSAGPLAPQPRRRPLPAARRRPLALICYLFPYKTRDAGGGGSRPLSACS